MALVYVIIVFFGSCMGVLYVARFRPWCSVACACISYSQLGTKTDLFLSSFLNILLISYILYHKREIYKF